MASEHWLLLRKRYEFSKETKLAALRRAEWKCEECGVKKDKAPKGYLEIDHVLPLWFVINYFPTMSEELVRSLDNARCLCSKCHDKKHEKESVIECSILAQALLGVKV